MKERTGRIVVASKSIGLGLIIVGLGILIAWNGYKIITTPGFLWSCDCCLGECHCDPSPMKIFGLVWVILSVSWALVLAYRFFINGYTYYRHGYFRREEKNMENDAVGWGE